MLTHTDSKTRDETGSAPVDFDVDSTSGSALKGSKLKVRPGTDVTVFGDGDGDGANCHYHTEQEPAARPRRTMGEVYPIMRNSIYEDDECEDEGLQSNGIPCGVRLILYANGLFQYLVRHPQLMGLVLTTLIILLFFKYSQQVVVQSVNYALTSHPGLEPSDALRSGVLSFTHELYSFVSVARLIGTAYTQGYVRGFDIKSVQKSQFLDTVLSFQRSFHANVFTYVIYQMIPEADTGLVKWGQIGCESTNGRVPYVSDICSLITDNGTLLGFNNSNISSAIFRADNRQLDANSELIKQVQSLTLNESKAGRWLRPTQKVSSVTNNTYRVITLVIPLFFNEANGRCTGAAAIDASVDFLTGEVTLQTPNSETVVVDSRYFKEDGGQFILDTLEPQLNFDGPYPVTKTPSSRINSIAQEILKQNGGTLMLNGSFFQNGLIYQSLTMMGTWAIITRSPLTLSSSEVQVSFRAQLDEYERLTAAAASLYGSSESCEMEANLRKDSVFLESIGNIQRSFGSRVYSFYVAYTLNGNKTKSLTGNSTLGWGACGCAYEGIRSSHLQCFYTNRGSDELVFNGSSISGTGEKPRSIKFSRTRRSEFVDEMAQQVSANNQTGYWTAPYSLLDTLSNSTLNAVSFVIPFQFDEHGKVTAAAILDMSTDFLPDFLATYIHLGTTGLYIIDRRENCTFMASTSYRPSGVFPCMQTKNNTINQYFEAVYTALNGTFEKGISFNMGSQLVNYQIIPPNWGVVEIIPGDVALNRFLPTPSVKGATDALRLIPTGETVALFLYVAGILAAYFLNLLILGCSRLGKKG